MRIWDYMTASQHAGWTVQTDNWPYVGSFRLRRTYFRQNVASRFWPEKEGQRIVDHMRENGHGWQLPELASVYHRFHDRKDEFKLRENGHEWQLPELTCGNHRFHDRKDEFKLGLFTRLEESFIGPFALPVLAHESEEGRRWMATTRAHIDSERRIYHATLGRKEAAERCDEWFRFESGDSFLDPYLYDGRLSGPRLQTLYCHATRATWCCYGHGITHEELAAWARKAFAEGELLAYEVLPTLEAFTRGRPGSDGTMLPNGIHTPETYAQIAVPYARRHEIDLGKVKSDVREITPPGSPHKVFEGSGISEPLRDETSEKCPSDNHRSESIDTATDEVRAWFGSEKNLLEHGDKTLGRQGGGGFLAGTTRVVELQPGTILNRYCIPKGAKGSWQLLKALEGDPRAFAALPADSPGTNMVKCRINKPVHALIGLGAPRCSNKPGGPIQICLPYKTVGDDPGSTATLI